MVKKKMKGFTLIELIAVLVIMAIIALIVTPLVMNLIRKARVAADKRSIDAYGRSIELAIAGYLLDNGYFPTDISQLTIEYSGSEVECSTTQLNSDSSVYLSGCTVAGRSIDYLYGLDKSSQSPTSDIYEVGDEVTYNNVDYYVIEDSATNVKLLKKTPLSFEEVSQYTSGTSINVYNENSYGNIPYAVSSSDIEYSDSYVKSVVDAWTLDNTNSSDLRESRLITYEELNVRETQEECCGGLIRTMDYVGYDWMYNSSYNYWIMPSNSGSEIMVFGVNNSGDVFSRNYQGMDTSTNNGRVIRPVIVLSKSANITKIDE